MKVATHVLQAVLILTLIAFAVICWRQCRVEGHINLLAAVYVGFWTTFWTNPYASTFHYAAANNRYDLNVESWAPYLPAWRGQTPAIESMLMNLGYPVMLAWVIVALAFVRLLRRRRSHWSSRQMIAATAFLMMLLDPIGTNVYSRLGGFAYPRALPGTLTLFKGHWYQLPVSSVFAVVTCWVMPTVVMFVYAGEGREALIFKGSSRLPPRAQLWIRLLAGVGLMNICVLMFQVIGASASVIGHPIDMPNWWSRPTS